MTRFNLKLSLFLSLSLIAGIASINGNHIIWITPFVIITSIIMRPGIKLFFKGLGLASFFSFFIFLSLLFSSQSPYYTIFNIDISMPGLYKALTVFFRLILINLVLTGLLSSFSPAKITSGLKYLFLPDYFCFFIFLIYRYSIIITQEAQMIKRAVMARGRNNFIISTNAIGGLFLRSLKKGERLMCSLTASNFEGNFFRNNEKLSVPWFVIIWPGIIVLIVLWSYF